ncbi:MAG: 6,7-dimethyl-8-ribityllumazine synthase [Verrucomicrobiota bacterium]
MSLDSPSLEGINGHGIRVAIAAARFNQSLVDSLLSRAVKTLEDSGAESPVVERVPGSAELPYAVSVLAESGKFDVVIAIGVVIAGDTNHHNLIGDSTADALQNIAIREKVPAINGILIVENIQQAEARTGDAINRGREFALAAIEMAQFQKKWTKMK